LQPYKNAVIPQIEEDQIVLYAAVEGKDIEGVLRRRKFQAYISKVETIN
jgi:hypothetical protein